MTLLVIALAACGRDAVVQPTTNAPKTEDAERENLLNYAHGAVAVSRTAEATRKGSIVRLIDGDREPGSFWSTPPHDTEQTLVFALPSRTRVTRVGAQNGGGGTDALRFEASLDGQAFRDLATVTLQRNQEPQLFDVPPTEAAYLRVSTPATDRLFIGLNSVHARGVALEPVRPGSMDGCWAIDAEHAAMTQQGAYVFGQLGELLLDGGSDGRFYRFAWIKGNEYGLAAISVTPDGRHMSGIKWHEEADPLFVGTTWIGEKTECAQQPRISDAVFRAYLEKQGRFPMYGLRFDDEGRLMEAESAVMLERLVQMKDVRIVANELRQPTVARNRAVAQAKLDTLRAALVKRGVDLTRFELVNHGSEQPHRPAETEATRSLYGAVDLELRR
ncbi:MAG TPA: discoidin domain-containing protein [Thermoanaerobaculia bacterium]|nr:discoidin domain-containing protein [Thermoanaerobaculia bacterium]